MGGRVVGTVPSLGTRWPAHATSTGKVLLAYRSNGHAHARPLPGFTPRTIVDPAALARELARVRRRGYAVSAEELEPGFVAVGAPVHAADGTVVAAISVGGPKTRLTAGRITEGARLVREPPRASRARSDTGRDSRRDSDVDLRQHPAGDVLRDHDPARAVLHRPRPLRGGDGAHPLRHVAVRRAHRADPRGGQLLRAAHRQRQRDHPPRRRRQGPRPSQRLPPPRDDAVRRRPRAASRGASSASTTPGRTASTARW